MALELGSTLGHYEILSSLGAGGMGEVYRARDTKLGREVAIKLLLEEVSTDPERMARFEREAKVLASLNHSNIATLYGYEADGNTQYLVMELVEGETLADAIERGPIPVEAAIPLFLQIAKALESAHQAGIIHRDLKPANIKVKEDGTVKVLDFGLAKRFDSKPEGDPSQLSTVTAAATQMGVILGTPAYMSPEQARGRPVDKRADIWAFGCALYEVLSGRRPFSGENVAATLASVIEREPDWEALPAATPQPIRRLLHRCLEKAPDRRLRDVGDARLELEDALTGSSLQMLKADRRLRPAKEEVSGAPHELAAGLRAPHKAAVRGDRHTVGRESERAELLSAFDAAANGKGSLLCISGEPGIGKTTLVEDFLGELETPEGGLTIARGRCSERLAGTEAYLPLLEALESLLGVDSSGSVARRMRELAPCWFVQVAPLAADDSSDPRLAEGLGAASQERMKRELHSFVQELSRLHPLVFFLDDLHWADVSTVDMLSYLGGRLGSTRALLIATYRGEEMTGHPFVEVRLDLQGRGLCRELQLGFLGEEAVASYLALEFPEHRFPEELARIIHSRSEGSPLFMVDLVRSLRNRDVLTERNGRWEVVQEVSDIVAELPESIRSVIERKIGQLPDEDRRLLLAASVQGDEFDAAVVARALGADAAGAEERLQVLERDFSFVQPVSENELPDGTLTLRYRFVHVLYQNALYASLTPARRASLSRGIAEALLGFHAEGSEEVASELAYLFEQARDFEQATRYFQVAATKAGRLFGFHEVIALARRGLELVEKLQEPEERARAELALQVTLGNALALTRGTGDAEVEQAYDRAQELCRQVGDDPVLFSTVQGLWTVYIQRNYLQTAHDLGMQSLELAQQGEDPGQVEVAQLLLGTSYFWRGLFPEAQDAFAAVLAPHPPRSVSGEYLGSIDARFGCLPNLGLILWLIGEPDQATQCREEARSVAEATGHPWTLCTSSLWEAWSSQMRREHRQALREAKACLGMAQQHGFQDWIAVAKSLIGCSMVEQGLDTGNEDQVNEGVAALEEGLRSVQVTGGLLWRPYFLPVLAELLARKGALGEARDALAKASDEAPANGEGFYRPEMERVKGAVLMLEAEAEGGLDPSRAEKLAQAEGCFREAIESAQRLGARSWELRAALDLDRLLQSQGRADEGRQVLAELYDRFEEGFDTPDLVEARRLLEQHS